MKERVAQKRRYPPSLYCVKNTRDGNCRQFTLTSQIFTQRGGFLGRVKVRNLVLLMAVTLFQRTKRPERPELRSPTSAIITASRLCNHRLISLEESAGQLTGLFFFFTPRLREFQFCAQRNFRKLSATRNCVFSVDYEKKIRGQAIAEIFIRHNLETIRHASS